MCLLVGVSTGGGGMVSLLGRSAYFGVVCLLGGVPSKDYAYIVRCLLGASAPLPLKIMIGIRLWKHYLPLRSVTILPLRCGWRNTSFRSQGLHLGHEFPLSRNLAFLATLWFRFCDMYHIHFSLTNAPGMLLSTILYLIGFPQIEYKVIVITILVFSSADGTPLGMCTISYTEIQIIVL